MAERMDLLEGRSVRKKWREKEIRRERTVYRMVGMRCSPLLPHSNYTSTYTCMHMYMYMCILARMKYKTRIIIHMSSANKTAEMSLPMD